MESDPIQFPGDERASPFQCLLFDLNGTLYPSRTGVAHAMERKMEEFLVLKCGFAEDKASDVRERLYLTYGTTLAGLKALGFEVNDNEYHDFVLPIELIQEDPNLRSLLQSIKQRKLLFTDSRLRTAVKILQKLGVEDCFQEIICFETMNQHPPETSLSGKMLDVVTKPSIEAMNMAIDVAGVDPHCTLFLDDEEDNVSAGKAVGFRTVLVGKRVKSNEADFVVETLVELRQAVPEIWALGSDD